MTKVSNRSSSSRGTQLSAKVIAEVDQNVATIAIAIVRCLERTSTRVAVTPVGASVSISISNVTAVVN